MKVYKIRAFLYLFKLRRSAVTGVSMAVTLYPQFRDRIVEAGGVKCFVLG